MKLFRAAEVVISPFMEGIARNFDHVRSIEKPQIFAFRLNLRFLLSFAEREGFEPSVPVSEYDGLANRWFQPLTYLSKLK